MNVWDPVKLAGWWRDMISVIRWGIRLKGRSSGAADCTIVTYLTSPLIILRKVAKNRSPCWHFKVYQQS